MARNKKAAPPKSSLQQRNNRLALGLLSPALIILAILTLVPMIYTLVISLFRYNLQRGSTPQAFIGLENYLNAFTDARFWDRVLTTTVYTVISVSITVVLGLLIALLLQKPSRRTFQQSQNYNLSPWECQVSSPVFSTSRPYFSLIFPLFCSCPPPIHVLVLKITACRILRSHTCPPARMRKQL